MGTALGSQHGQLEHFTFAHHCRLLLSKQDYSWGQRVPTICTLAILNSSLLSLKSAWHYLCIERTGK